MLPIKEFLLNLSPVIIISIVANMITACVTFHLLLYVHQVKVSSKRFLLGTSVITVFYLVLLYIASYFHYPQPINELLYSILIFENPLGIFIVYPVFKYIFKVKDSVTIMSVEGIFCGLYLSRLVFLTATDVWTLIPGLFSADLAAMITSVSVSLLFLLIFKKYVRKSEQFMSVPDKYLAGKITWKSMFRPFMYICSFYFILVIVRYLFMTQRTDITLNRAILYFVLIIIISLRIAHNFKDDKVAIQGWEITSAHNYIDSLINANSDFRGVKHDFNNILQVYGAYIDINDIANLKTFHQSLIQIMKTTGDALAFIESLHSRPAVYGILKAKLERAERLGVLINISHIEMLNGVNLGDMDLCRVLSNLIDNAIEAAEESEGKYVSISCAKHMSSFVNIEISNSTKDDVETERIFGSGFTTKVSHNGQGLATVKKIISQYKNSSVNISYSANVFSVSLIVPVQLSESNAENV